MRSDETRELAESWVTHLEPERKSPETIQTHMAGLDAYIRWCDLGTFPSSLPRSRSRRAAGYDLGRRGRSAAHSHRRRGKGGQVTSLMALGGWSDISMVRRYIKAAEDELAVGQARRLS